MVKPLQALHLCTFYFKISLWPTEDTKVLHLDFTSQRQRDISERTAGEHRKDPNHWRSYIELTDYTIVEHECMICAHNLFIILPVVEGVHVLVFDRIL